MKELCNRIDKSFTELIKYLVVEELPDSRSVGGKIEHYVQYNWQKFCGSWNVKKNELPGARSLYDISFNKDNDFFGINIKTKNLESDKYSDGGIGAVSNLLRFYTKESGVFLITEFGYKLIKNNYEFSYVRTVPFHSLPLDTYRIENLGTGQIRLNKSIKEIYDNIDWNRSITEFYDHFSILAMNHYDKVANKANDRKKAIKSFIDSKYKKITIR